MAYKQTHCKRGHEFTKENSGWSANGQCRYCKKCKVLMEKNNRNKNKYGMTSDEAKLARQNPCEICGKLKNGMGIDHCHTSGKVRGILCTNCNTMLGHIEDNKEILFNAIKYLDKHNQKPGAEVRPEIYQFM